MSQAVLDRLTAAAGLGPALREVTSLHGNEIALVEREALLRALRFLRDDPETSFDFLTDLTCVDYMGYPARQGRSARFEMVYQLYSTEKKHRLRVKVDVPGDEKPEPWVDSVVPIWPGAGWLEREVWDMYGIVFKGHPDLRRILMYEEFVGHPLRKDYPKERRQPLVRRSGASS